MKKQLFIGLLLLVISIENFSQNFITFSGTIKNRNDSSFIELATISIKNTFIGTVSNAEGRFILHLSEKYKDSTLVISSLGFKSFSQKISKLGTKTNFALEPQDYEIDEILVFPIKETANELVELAIKNFGKNYPKRKHYIDAFYREIAYKQSSIDKTEKPKAERLIEAALGIHDYGVNAPNTIDRIRINEMRKSTDYMEYSFASKNLNKFFGEKNALYEIFNSFSINNSSEFRKYLMSLTYRIEGTQMYENTLVVVIAFEDMSQKINYYYGYLYINTENYAIVKIERYRSVHEKYRKHFAFLNKNGTDYLEKMIRTYKEFDGKYYVNYIESFGGIGTRATTYNKDFDYRGDCQLMVNNIYTKKDDYDRIRRKEIANKQTELANIEFKYNPKFWESYNTILLNKLQTKVKEELEREEKLENQFKKTSN